MNQKCLWVLGILLSLSHSSFGQIISPTSEELGFSYSASFLTDASSVEDGTDAAYNHSQHIFGIMHSPRLTQNAGLNPNLVGGIGAIRMPMKISVTSINDLDDGTVEVKYRASGVMLIHKTARLKLVKDNKLTLPLPYKMDSIYDKKCTDDHYDTEGDYWYFYDVYRKGCEYLQEEPHARKVNITLKETAKQPTEVGPNLKQLRGDNGNGNILKISIFQGYADDSRQRGDEGRRNFMEMNKRFAKAGFGEKIKQSAWTRPLHVFEREMEIESKQVKVEIHHQLIDTAIDSKTTLFAKKFKEAVADSDVIIYLGHSGLGGNLDIPSLERKAGEFEVDARKYQIYFFDSCSSYSYYLDSFKSMKRKNKIDVLTNGLSSYFETSNDTLSSFINNLLSAKHGKTWLSILREMEKPLEGTTFLLNVGGV